MLEALARVKASCGDDAVIKATRKVQPERGTFTRPWIEVLAAPGAPRDSAVGAGPSRSPQRQSSNASGVNQSTSDAASSLERRVMELTRIVGELSMATKPCDRADAMLRAAGLEAPLSEELSRDLPFAQDVQRKLMAHVLRGRIAACVETKPDLLEQKGPRIVACVGPTGAGKTTTLAKLAARARLEHGKRVGVISLDTFRVGAASQWERYARLLDIPFHTASSQEQADAALQALTRCDLILIDTAGNLSNAGVHRERTTSMLRALPDRDLETLLVLPAWLRGRDALRMAEQFAEPKPTGMVLTKVDETESYGGGIQASVMHSLPIAYVCDGPHVPNDIHWRSSTELAELLLPSEGGQ